MAFHVEKATLMLLSLKGTKRAVIKLSTYYMKNGDGYHFDVIKASQFLDKKSVV